jgi:hypothetical protein
MNNLTEIITIAGILLMTVVIVFIVIKVFKSIGGSNSSYAQITEKLARTFPKNLTSQNGINSFKEFNNISASNLDVYLNFSALILLALEQAGHNKDVRIPEPKMKQLSTKLSSNLLNKFLKFSKISISKKELQKKQAKIRKDFNNAWAKGLSITSAVDFNVNAPHNEVGKIISKNLQGSFHPDFIKFSETHLSGQIILIRDILSAGQVCYNLL